MLVTIPRHCAHVIDVAAEQAHVDGSSAISEAIDAAIPAGDVSAIDTSADIPANVAAAMRAIRLAILDSRAYAEEDADAPCTVAECDAALAVIDRALDAVAAP